MRYLSRGPLPDPAVGVPVAAADAPAESEGLFCFNIRALSNNNIHIWASQVGTNKAFCKTVELHPRLLFNSCSKQRLPVKDLLLCLIDTLRLDWLLTLLSLVTCSSITSSWSDNITADRCFYMERQKFTDVNDKIIQCRSLPLHWYLLMYVHIITWSEMLNNFYPCAVVLNLV